MFTFDGRVYKSKSTVALQMLREGKSRMDISKALGIKYQTVHALMTKHELKAAPRVKKSEKTPTHIEQTTTTENTEASNS